MCIRDSLHTELMLDVGGTFSLQTGTNGNDKWVISNGSFCNLEDCGVIRRIGKDQYEVAWIGELTAGSQSPELRFASVPNGGEGLIATWQKSSKMAGTFDLANRVWEAMGVRPDQQLLPERLAENKLLADRWEEIEEPLQVRMRELETLTVSRDLLSEVMQGLTANEPVGVSEILGTVLRNLLLGPGEVRLIGQTKQKLDQTKFVPEATQIRQNLLVVTHLRHSELPPCQRDVNAISDFATVNISNLDQENFLDEIERFDAMRRGEDPDAEDDDSGEEDGEKEDSGDNDADETDSEDSDAS